MSYFHDHKVHFLRILIIGLSMFLLTNCAKRLPDSDTHMQVPMTSKGLLHQGEAAMQDTGLSGKSPNANPPDQTDYKILEPVGDTTRPEIGSKKTQYQFDDTPSLTVAVEDLSMPDFINRIFGDLLQVNYVLSNKVTDKEKLSLSLDKKVSPRMLFDTVMEVLNRYKISVVEKEGVFYIEPAADKAAPSLGWGKAPADIPEVPGQVRQIVPLRYIDAQSMMTTIGSVPDAQIATVLGENAISVVGSREGVERVLQYVSVFDQPAMRGRFVAMQRIKYWTPSDLIGKLKEILSMEGIPWSDSPGQSGIKLLNIDRWRLILIFAAEKQWIDRVNYWINLLDVPEEAKAGQYFIFFPENSRASDLMTTLKTILGVSSDKTEPSKTPGNETPAALSQSTGGAGASTGSATQTSGRAVSAFQRTAGSKALAAKQTTLPTKNESEAAAGPGIQGLAVDDARNALIIYTDADHYNSIEALLKQLDIMPPQVFIEATVAEVTLTDNLQFGLEWYLKNTENSQTSVLSTIKGLGVGSAGLNYSMVTDSEKYKVLINALAEKDLVQVLSSPTLTVRDGETASMNVGTQVPVVTSEVASTDVNTNNTTGVVRGYQYLSTGISLEVTPRVHARDVVDLKISQDVSEPSSSGGENPLILNRTISTDVVATSGQTLLLGGLIKQNKSKTDSKVPLFGDIPLLKYLFKNTKEGMNRTELVVMITPHIIRSTLEINDIQKKVFESFEQLELSTTKAQDEKVKEDVNSSVK